MSLQGTHQAVRTGTRRREHAAVRWATGTHSALTNTAPRQESFLVGEVLRLAARAGIRGVVSFSDPVARFDQHDRRVMPGHWGCTYQACNAVPVGGSWKRTHWVLPDGTFFSPVRMQKIRAQASGHEYAERLLIRWDARPMRAFEDPKAWLAEALRTACRDRDGNPRKFTHPGCIRYAWRTGETRAQRRAVHIAPETHRPNWLWDVDWMFTRPGDTCRKPLRPVRTHGTEAKLRHDADLRLCAMPSVRELRHGPHRYAERLHPIEDSREAALIGGPAESLQDRSAS